MSIPDQTLPPAIRTAVIPAAGLGTRSLPASKAVPKEMLPVVDKPVIQYAIEEALAAGIERIVLVLSPGKEAVVAHFCRQELLNSQLRRTGKAGALSKVTAAELPNGRLITVLQQSPLGLGHAVGCARDVINGDPFAVMLPDDLMLADTPVLKQMVDAYAYGGGRGHLIATQPVPREDIDKYGILTIDGDVDDRATLPVAGLVEKPSADDAPSDLGIVGRYILDPSIFEVLDSQGRGSGGEIQLTDAIARQIGTVPVNGFRYDGARFDCGSGFGLVQATIAFGLRDPQIAGMLRRMVAPIAGPDRIAAA